MIGTLSLFLVLLALSGFFSGAEIAFFSLTQARARALADEGRRGARALLALKQNPDRLLITILIGNNVANISAASVATFMATRAVGSAGVGIATGAVTLLVLIFGEITPKSFAARNAGALALLSAPVIEFLSRALFFAVRPLEALTRALIPRGTHSGHVVSEAEIRKLTQMGHVAGAIQEHERRIIERAFLLDTTRAWEVMVPRVDVFAWPEHLRLGEIARELPSVRYSRIPLYGESLDDVTGILYLRDAYHGLVEGREEEPLARLAREPFFVPRSVSLVELLGQFQARRMHLGIVVDEYGGTDGIVTLEDLLEELVGEIVDEVDLPEESIRRVGQNELIVEGTADLRDVNHHLKTGFPVSEHRSLNGYLLEELGRVPGPGEAFEREGVRIEVLAASETQVLRARLRRRPARPGSGEADAAGTRGASDQRPAPG